MSQSRWVAINHPEPHSRSTGRHGQVIPNRNLEDVASFSLPAMVAAKQSNDGRHPLHRSLGYSGSTTVCWLAIDFVAAPALQAEVRNVDGLCN